MRITTLILLFYFTFQTLHLEAQKLNHELGVFAGAISMQTDYGQRGDFPSSYANIGIGAGISYYLSYDVKRMKWNDRLSYMKNHLRLKVDISYMSDNFIHRGDYIKSNSVTAVKLAAMKGSTKLFNVGGQIEYYLFEFSNFRKWEPYISGGFYHVNFDPDLETSLGDWRDNPSLIPDIYLDGGLFLEKGNTQALSFGGGTRITNSNNFSIVLDMRWQRFLSNKIDGLDPKTGADKYREWLFFLNVGAVFKLN